MTTRRRLATVAGGVYAYGAEYNIRMASRGVISGYWLADIKKQEAFEVFYTMGSKLGVCVNNFHVNCTIDSGW